MPASLAREEEPPSLLEPHLLLELERAHRRHGLELVMEAGNAHPDPSRERRDPERPVVLLAQDLDRLGDPASAPADRGDLAEPVALVALREPVHDLAHRDHRSGGGLRHWIR